MLCFSLQRIALALFLNRILSDSVAIERSWGQAEEGCCAPHSAYGWQEGKQRQVHTWLLLTLAGSRKQSETTYLLILENGIP